MAADALPVHRVCGYPRKSPLGGGAQADEEERDSLNRQDREMREWCAAQGPKDGCRYELVAMRPETDMRYWLKGRSVLMGILDECRAGLYDIVLVYDVTRFVGKANHIGWLSVEFEETGATFRYVHNDPGTGKLASVMQYLQAYGSEQEVDRLIVRVRGGKRDRHERRQCQPSPAPLGTVWNHIADPTSAPYARDRYTRLVADPTPTGRARLALVRRLFAEMEAERPSATELARRLVREGVPSPRGGVWTAGAVLRTLRNRGYRGDYVYFKTQRTVVGRGAAEHWEQLPRERAGWLTWEGHHEGFVPAAQWDAVQAILDDQAARPRFPARTALGERFLLTGGLVRCAGCGRPLTNAGTWTATRDPGGAFGPGDRVPYYGCSSTRGSPAWNRLAGKGEVCPEPARIRADALDRAVWDALLDASRAPQRPSGAPARADDPQRTARRLEREVAKKRDALQRVERKAAEEPDPERRAAQEALAVAYAVEIRHLEARRQAGVATERAAALRGDGTRAALALIQDHWDRLLAGVPWGPAPASAEQDAWLRSVLAGVGAQVLVFRRGGRAGARGGYAGLLRERPWAIRFVALQADDGADIWSVFGTTSGTAQGTDLAAALTAGGRAA
jgi:hypothetical protein